MEILVIVFFEFYHVDLALEGPLALHLLGKTEQFFIVVGRFHLNIIGIGLGDFHRLRDKLLHVNGAGILVHGLAISVLRNIGNKSQNVGGSQDELRGPMV